MSTTKSNREFVIDLSEDEPKLQPLKETSQEEAEVEQNEEKDPPLVTELPKGSNREVEEADEEINGETEASDKPSRANKRIQKLLQQNRSLKAKLEENLKEQVNQKKAAREQQKRNVDQNLETLNKSLDTIKKALKEAVASGDAEAVTNLTENLADIKADIKVFTAAKNDPDFFEENEPNEADIEADIGLDEDSETMKWVKANPWFQPNTLQAQRAAMISTLLIGEGMDQEDPEFYKELDRRASEDKILAPFYASTRKGQKTATKGSPVSTQRKEPVTKSNNNEGGSRTSSGKPKITLTQDDLDFAKRMQLTPEQFALEKYKHEQAEKAGSKWVER